MYSFSVLMHMNMTKHNAARTHQLLQITLH